MSEFKRSNVLDWPSIQDTIIDHGRWDVTHRRIFEHDGVLYECFYSQPATEYQEGGYDEDETIECNEVVAIERMMTVYERPR